MHDIFEIQEKQEAADHNGFVSLALPCVLISKLLSHKKLKKSATEALATSLSVEPPMLLIF